MFDPTSRYAPLPTTTLTTTDADGEPRVVRYVRRRFIATPDANAPDLARHTVTQDERLDNISARYLGDPTLFWRICDANDALRPDELTDEVGRVLRIALPQQQP